MSRCVRPVPRFSSRFRGVRWLATLGVLGLALPGPALAQEEEPLPPGLYAELSTAKGLIVINLEFKRVPMTVANFVGLAEGTIRNQALPLGTPYYDGSAFHRVAPGHVIQAGSPVSEVASTPGYSIPNEIDPELSNGKEGMVGMVNGGPHTGKSQFYITLGDRSYLDGDYAVFGEVIRGMDVVRSIAQGDIIETVRIRRIGEEAGAFRPTTESFRQMRREVWARVPRRGGSPAGGGPGLSGRHLAPGDHHGSGLALHRDPGGSGGTPRPRRHRPDPVYGKDRSGNGLRQHRRRRSPPLLPPRGRERGSVHLRGGHQPDQSGIRRGRGGHVEGGKTTGDRSCRTGVRPRRLLRAPPSW